MLADNDLIFDHLERVGLQPLFLLHDEQGTGTNRWELE